jgi:hypothetical protein
MTKCIVCKCDSPTKIDEIVQSVLADQCMDTLRIDTGGLLQREGAAFFLLQFAKQAQPVKALSEAFR